MARGLLQPVLWLLVFVQSIGLCRCLVAQAAGPESVVIDRDFEGMAGDHDDHPDEPAGQLSCGTKVSAKAQSGQSNHFVVLVSATAIDISTSSDRSTVLPPYCAPAGSHTDRNLPLLI
jgi:hypothetical protein